MITNMDGHRRAERRSLAYHRAIAERVADDASVLESARRRVAAWRETRSVDLRQASAWDELLQRPAAEIAVALVDESEHMTALRQVSPFAGALDPRTRWQLWRSVG